jgi:hypothetical protein
MNILLGWSENIYNSKLYRFIYWKDRELFNFKNFDEKKYYTILILISKGIIVF